MRPLEGSVVQARNGEMYMARCPPILSSKNLKSRALLVGKHFVPVPLF